MVCSPIHHITVSLNPRVTHVVTCDDAFVSSQECKGDLFLARGQTLPARQRYSYLVMSFSFDKHYVPMIGIQTGTHPKCC